MTKKLTPLIKKAERDPHILAVAIYGSTAKREASRNSDIDVCVFLEENSFSSVQISKKRLEYLKNFDFDIQIFQQLPIYIRTRVLKEGEIIHVKDEDKLYELAFKTITEFSDFEHFYNEYLQEVENAG